MIGCQSAGFAIAAADLSDMVDWGWFDYQNLGWAHWT